MSAGRSPVSGGLGEIPAVGEVEQDGPGGMQEFGDAGDAPIGVQGEIRGMEECGDRVKVANYRSRKRPPP